MAGPHDHHESAVADGLGAELGPCRQVGADLEIDPSVPEVVGVGGTLGGERS
jgi:hypothetical protein